MKAFSRRCSAVLLTSLAGVTLHLSSASAQTSPKWCDGVRIRFFTGGAEGDAFGSIIQRGAEAAAADTGAKLDLLYSAWNPETMLAQLRDAIAVQPNGIAMVGHPGEPAIMPMAEAAKKAGIVMAYHNVDLPKVRAALGGGYVGSDLSAQGKRLAQEALAKLKLKAGDRAVVFGAFGRAGRELRDIGVAEVFEAAGLKVDRIVVPPELFRDPLQLTPQVTASVLRNPDLKVMVFSGGQLLGTVPQYMAAAGVKPGEISNIGFDLNPAVLDAMKGGFVQMTSDQQPFLQGYLPVVSLCSSIKRKMTPLTVDTGTGLVTPENAQDIAELVKQGIR